MTLYPGTKSLDAEIALNFFDGNIVMDYSLNKFGSPYESNTSTILASEWKTTSIVLKFIYLVWLGILLLALFAVALIVTTMTFLSYHRFVTNHKIQYYYQSYLKFFYSNLKGISEQSSTGQLYSNQLIFIIPNNLWIEYELSGEYQNKIKVISLLRNFINRKRFGRFAEKVQWGWKIVFEFVDIPQSGSCIIRYVN